MVSLEKVSLLFYVIATPREGLGFYILR